MSDEAQIEREIMRLLRNKSQTGRSLQRSRHCPDEHLLAGYAEGRLTIEQRAAVEAHVADCSVCLEDVATSAHLGDVPLGHETLPRRVRAHLEELEGVTPGWHSRFSWKTVGAVAASAALIALFLIRPDSETVRVDSSADPGIRLRSDKAFHLRPSITWPVEGAELTRKALEFRWTGFPGHAYEIELVEDDGALIWSAEVQQKAVTLPHSVALEVGERYYISVVARGAGGRTSRSRFVGFRISEP